MGVLHNYMFCALMVIVGISFAQEYDSGANMEMTILKYHVNNVIMDLQAIKADLKVEKAKTIKLEKQVNILLEENKITKINKTDSDLPGHVSVEDQQQAMDRVSSSIEQRVYQALNDEKMLRKQFQNQTQTDFKTEQERMENKFTVLNETLSAVIETKLQTIENKVRDSVIIINESISSIDNISRLVTQNGEDIMSLRVEPDQLNTTLIKHGALLSSLNDYLVVVQASVIEFQTDSHQYKEDNSRTVQQNNEAINNLLVQSEYGKITLLRHDAALTSLNDTLVDIRASVVELRNDSLHYKENNSRTVQRNIEAIHNLLAQFQQGNATLLRHDAALTSLNDSLVDIHTSVVELRDDSRHYKEDNSRTVQQNNEAINNLLVQSKYGKISLMRHDAALTSLNDTIVDIHASVVELRNDSRHYKENNSRTVQRNIEVIHNLLAQSIQGNATLLRHDATLTALNDSLEDIHTSVVELRNDSRHYKEDNSRTVQQNNEAINNLLVQSEYGKISLLRHDAALTSLNDTLVDMHASVVELRNDSRHYKENNSRTVQRNIEAINNLLAQSQQGNTTLLRHDAALTSLNDTLVDIHTSVVELRNDNRHYKENNSRTVQHNNEVINNLVTQSQHGNTTLLRHDSVILSLKDSLVDLQASVMEIYKDYTKNYPDCYDIHQKTGFPTGLYYVKPHGLNEIVKVMCDMDTDGGGWTVFQYRHDGSVDFYRNFTDYENGFGSVTSEFWLGLSYIQVMTSAAPTQLRIDVEAADGKKGFQLYDNFHLTKGPDYALNVGTSSGTIGDSDSLSYNNGSSFYTHDHDKDGTSGSYCAELRHGGWWYNSCTYVNLNGQYVTLGTTSRIDHGRGGMVYYTFKDNESLKSSKIMFRRT